MNESVYVTWAFYVAYALVCHGEYLKILCLIIFYYPCLFCYHIITIIISTIGPLLATLPHEPPVASVGIFLHPPWTHDLQVIYLLGGRHTHLFPIRALHLGTFGPNGHLFFAAVWAHCLCNELIHLGMLVILVETSSVARSIARKASSSSELDLLRVRPLVKLPNYLYYHSNQVLPFRCVI